MPVTATIKIEKTFRRITGNTGVIKIQDSDLGRGKRTVGYCTFDSDDFIIPADTLMIERIPITEVIEVAEIDATIRKSTGSVVSRGFVGGLLFGIVGAVAGMLTAKNTSTVTMAVRFRDGRSFVGTSSAKVLSRLKSFMFTYKPNGDVRLAGEPRITTEDQTWKFTAKLAIVGLVVSAIVFYLVR